MGGRQSEANSHRRTKRDNERQPPLDGHDLSGSRPINQIYWFSKQIFAQPQCELNAIFFEHGMRLPWRAASTICHDWSRTKTIPVGRRTGVKSSSGAGGALMTQSAEGLSTTMATRDNKSSSSSRMMRGEDDVSTRMRRERRQFVARLVELCAHKNRINGTDNEKMHSWRRAGTG